MDAYPQFLSNTTMMTIIIVAGVFVFLAVVVCIISLFGRRKNNKFDYDEFIEALGGIDNLEGAEAKTSRLNIVVKDKKDLDKEKIQDLGASAIVITSRKVTLIMGRKSKEIAAHLNKIIKK